MGNHSPSVVFVGSTNSSCCASRAEWRRLSRAYDILMFVRDSGRNFVQLGVTEDAPDEILNPAPGDLEFPKRRPRPQGEVPQIEIRHMPIPPGIAKVKRWGNIVGTYRFELGEQKPQTVVASNRKFRVTLTGIRDERNPQWPTTVAILSYKFNVRER